MIDVHFIKLRILQVVVWRKESDMVCSSDGVTLSSGK